ncbi:MAG: hypothetical protein AAFR25_02840 [Cyanobacteria bacterium J06629_19]
MASPAARPYSQCYTAGSCTLDVEVQPSALSQWSARPIAQTLSFQLWLDDESAATESKAARQLIAQGDHTDLRSLTHYFQQQTQSVLAIATISAHFNNRNRLAANTSPPQCLQRTAPLSYLQLCDISTVLDQHQQSTKTLPIALAATASKSEPSNVIPISAAQQQTTQTNPRQANPRARSANRRKRISVWGSSAAAALFAVGLTTTLISRDPSLKETNVASDAIPEAQEESAPLDEENQSDSAVVEPSPSAADTPEDSTATETDRNSPTASEQNPQVDTSDPSRRPSPNSATETPSRILDSVTADSGTAGNRPPRTPASNTEQTPEDSPVSPPATASTRPEAPPAGVSPAEESDDDRAFTPPPTDTPRETTGGASRGADFPPPAPSSPTPSSQEPAQQRQVPADIARSRQPSAESAIPEILVEGETSPDAPARDDAPADQAPAAEPPASIARARLPEALSQEPSPDSTVITINQVRSYFQQRWQSTETESLSYRLQLNAAGEIVSFIGLDDVSQMARDRILPTGQSPIFNNPPPTNESVLRIQLMSNGVVEVTPF